MKFIYRRVGEMYMCLKYLPKLTKKRTTKVITGLKAVVRDDTSRVVKSLKKLKLNCLI